ncbi:MAG: hypothetical protein QOE22_434 [Candidatus Parcubacteria bacterium]|nr:hypothetical protein [Candidatus Parcubacteria bacterium]
MTFARDNMYMKVKNILPGFRFMIRVNMHAFCFYRIADRWRYLPYRTHDRKPGGFVRFKNIPYRCFRHN